MSFQNIPFFSSTGLQFLKHRKQRSGLPCSPAVQIKQRPHLFTVPPDLQSDEEDHENPLDYCKGGYHPVCTGEIYSRRYEVMRKLGWGHFSTVWLCWDLQAAEFVAMKVVKSAPHYTETALDEIRLLKCIRDTDPGDPHRSKVIMLRDEFRITGVNGTHICMVLELLGSNLLRWLHRGRRRGLPLPCVRAITRQVLEGLAYLHGRCQVIHTDIKPENVLLCLGGIQEPAGTGDMSWRVGEEEAFHARPAPCVKKGMASWKTRRRLLPTSQRQAILHSQRRKEAEGERNVLSGLGWARRGLAKLLARHTSQPPAISSWEPTPVAAPLPVFSGPEPSPWCSLCDWDWNRTISPYRSFSLPQIALDESHDLQHRRDVRACACSWTSRHSGTSSHSTRTSSPGAHSMAGWAPAPANHSCTPGLRRSASLYSSRHLSQAPSLGERSDTVDLLDPAQVDRIRVKLADFGNACWTYQQFTEDIQTRQYRSLEVLIGAGYGTAADIWSTACMVFELATGDYLFEPHSGVNYSRDEDHIALIMELLGKIHRKVILGGQLSHLFFNKKGELHSIPVLRPWSLPAVLTEKYGWPVDEAFAFSNFLLPMLHPQPHRRATAKQSLRHAWLNT
uniref:SRSF protein kinase 3-like n=1 Tax=Myxine glutinosa TaxID=7769 RepID=UPI00358F304B